MARAAKVGTRRFEPCPAIIYGRQSTARPLSAIGEL